MKTIIMCCIYALIFGFSMQLIAQKPKIKEPVQKVYKLVESSFETTDETGKNHFVVTIIASNKIPDNILKTFRKTLKIYPRKKAFGAKKGTAINLNNKQKTGGNQSNNDLIFWQKKKTKPNPSNYEFSVNLKAKKTKIDPADFIWSWSDGFEAVMPGILKVKEEYRDMSTSPDVIVGLITFPEREGTANRVTGCLVCEAPNGTARVTNPIPNATIIFGDYVTTTDDAGNFEFIRDFEGIPSGLTLQYEAYVQGPRVNSTKLQIMNDWHNTREEGVTIPEGTIRDGHLQLGTITVEGGDCEIWRLAVELLDDYHATVDASPPYGELRIKRWAGVVVGTAYTFYDYIILPTDWMEENAFSFGRRGTLFHEFGHSIRHVADGSEAHWNWDNFRWAYARHHTGTEISNKQYAFNEGWAEYWERISTGVTTGGVFPHISNLEWVEVLIGEYLEQLSLASSKAEMVQVLTDNAGEIHSLWEFEQKYCEMIGNNAYCRDGVPLRAEPNECPPEYIDDGATCRLNNIMSKPSEPRGAGIPPRDCGAGNEYDSGLCYPRCRDGYRGILHLCWENCPPGYHDDGLTCRRDVRIISADNSECPGYDLCGLTFARGCSTCPDGYENDGCTCRINAHIFGKASYSRGVGIVPRSCQDGMVYDWGLCYRPCDSGYTGVGPVCWGTCPPGWDDHGATCYRAPNIIVKY